MSENRPRIGRNVTCTQCPYFYPTPNNGLIVGRCQLFDRWIWEKEQRCNEWQMHKEENRKKFRRETKS